MNNAKNIYIVEYEFLDGPYPEDYCGYNTIYADTNIDKALVEFNKKVEAVQSERQAEYEQNTINHFSESVNLIGIPLGKLVENALVIKKHTFEDYDDTKGKCIEYEHTKRKLNIV